MNIGDKVKVLRGFNPDLIGKEATVVGTSGTNIEVIIKGREAMRYEIPANTVVNLSVKEKPPEPEQLQPITESKHRCSCKDVELTLKNSIEFLEEMLIYLKNSLNKIQQEK